MIDRRKVPGGWLVIGNAAFVPDENHLWDSEEEENEEAGWSGRCPDCNSGLEVAPGRFHIEAGIAKVDMGCTACGSCWTEHYKYKKSVPLERR